MKKTFAIITIVALLAVALAGCGLNIHLGGITVAGPGKLFDVNDHGEQDLAGVETIEIATVSDTVTLTASGDKATADLKGQCRSTDKPVYLDMYKDGSILHIDVKYPSVTTSSNTALDVSIPAEYKGNLTIKTVSGGIEATALPYELQKVELESISGSVNLDAKSIASLKASSTSGSVVITGIAGETTASSISGGVDLDFNTIARTSASSISGNVKIKVPKDASFDVEFSTVSGSFHSSNTGLDVTSAHGFSGSAGDGGVLLKVNTTSGDFRLEGK